jgi:hydrogenase-4 component E
VTTALIWVILLLGLGCVVMRRRSVAVALVGVQSLCVAVLAVLLVPSRPSEFIPAALTLVLRALVILVLLVIAIRRTRQSLPGGEETIPLIRLVVAGLIVAALVGLVPAFGLASHLAEHGAIALIATGLALLVTRRATLFQVVALLVAENGIALAAVNVRGGLPIVIELGVAFDLVLVVTVAMVFHDRIFDVFGTSDTYALRELRD